MKISRVLALAIALTTALATAQQPAAVADPTSPTPTMHVTSIHKATDAEKTYHTAFGQEFIETTIGNMHYTLESLTGWAAGCTLEIGKDYEVVKASQKGVVIMCPASGRIKAHKDTFNVTTVSEATPPAS